MVFLAASSSTSASHPLLRLKPSKLPFPPSTPTQPFLLSFQRTCTTPRALSKTSPTAPQNNAAPWIQEKALDLVGFAGSVTQALPGPRVGRSSLPWILAVPLAYTGVTFVIAFFKTIQKFSSPKLVIKNAMLCKSIDELFQKGGDALQYSALEALMKKKDCSMEDILRKYSSYALNEKPFNPELVANLIQLSKASMLDGAQVAEILNEILRHIEGERGTFPVLCFFNTPKPEKENDEKIVHPSPTFSFSLELPRKLRSRLFTCAVVFNMLNFCLGNFIMVSFISNWVIMAISAKGATDFMVNACKSLELAKEEKEKEVLLLKKSEELKKAKAELKQRVEQLESENKAMIEELISGVK